MKFIMIEDHSLVRQGVSKIIEEKSDFCCAGTFATVAESKDFLKEFCKSYDHEPLIFIIDINLGNDDGISLIKFIKENYQNIYCICYSALSPNRSDTQRRSAPPCPVHRHTPASWSCGSIPLIAFC